MNVTLELESDFSGAAHARGFPVQPQCHALGTGRPSVTLRLSAAGCGLRITPHPGGGLLYSVVVEVQTARHLQQATDPVLAVSCVLPDYVEGDDAPLGSDGNGNEQADRHSEKSRGGRMMADNGESAKAWLGIQGSEGDEASVTVGEPTTLTVNARLPAHAGCRVVDCWAHDGLGETSQALLDANGCPAASADAEAGAEAESESALVPAPVAVRDETMSGRRARRLLTLAATFPAFKFPDRDSVHIRCGLQVCRGSCPQTDCSTNSSSRQRSQRTLKGEEGEVIDYVQLFNSVEVVAPAIDADDARRRAAARHRPRLDAADAPAANADAAGGVCFPASRVALALAALGAPALLAALVAGLCVVVARRRPTDNSRSSLSAWSYGYGRI